MTKTNNTQIHDEYHVASFVAHAKPHCLDQVSTEINQSEGAEIHGVNEQGKIVFTLEANSHKAIGRQIDLLKQHTGLVNLFPVYHQFDPQDQQVK
jgi:nitrate reductase NapD